MHPTDVLRAQEGSSVGICCKHLGTRDALLLVSGQCPFGPYGYLWRVTVVSWLLHVCLSVAARQIADVCLFVGCLTSQQHASVSKGRICSDNFTYCHTEMEVADQAFYLTQSQSTDTGPTSPSTVPITPGDWQGSHWSASF